MNNRINTYEDLLQEKQRLQALLQAQKELVRHDIDEIKLELAPARAAISFIGKLTIAEPGNPLITGTVNTVVDIIMRNLLLARAGWITKLVVPFFVKNFSSHLIDEKKDKILRKVFSWFGKKKKKHEHTNGKMEPMEEEIEED